MPRFIIADSGAVERTIKRLFIADSGGVERLIKRLFVIDAGGTARLVHSGTTVAFTGGTSAANGPGGSFVELEIRSDGTVWRIADGLGNAQLGSWITPNDAADDENYEVRFTQQSGDPFEVGILGSWLDLSTSQGVGYSAPDGESGVVRVQIRLSTDILATQDYTITN